MEYFLFYIGKTALAAGSFYLLYLAFFQHQKHFVFNRIYLPVSLAISFIIPLITFTSVQYIQPIEVNTINSFAYLPETTTTESVQVVYQWYHYLFGVYILGSICFLLFLILGHLKATRIIRFSRIKELFGAEVNVTKRDVHPFSFFSRIVLSEKTLANPNLEMIVNHEMIHVREKHTLDILFAEILFLFQWFNPFAWLIRDAMRNNLEYLTDHQVTQLHNAEHYQLAMVGLAHKKGVAPFLTALNGSQLKNRIIMMKKKTKNRYSLLKQFVVLPLLAFLVMSLSNKEVKTEILEKSTANRVIHKVNTSNTVTGRITNQYSNSAISEANIQIKEYGIETNSDANGNFILEFGTNKEPILVEVTANGYHPNNLVYYGVTSELNVVLTPIENTVEKLTSMKIVVDGKIIPTDHPNLKEMDFSKSFDSGKICEALNLSDIEVNSMVINEEQPTLYIRTSAYIEGTNKEFEDHTSTKTTNSTPIKTKNYYAIDGKIVPQDEFEKQGKKGFDNVIFLTGNDATKKYGKEFDGTVADATTGSSKFKIKKTITIKGTVTNEEGKAISAATVVVEGTATGTITDKTGYYELETERNSTLIFSMIGYERKKVEVNKQKEINVQLKASKGAPKDEIKIIGYGKQGADVILAGLGEEKEQIQRIKLSSKMENPPLYFVDGKETENLDRLDTNDIKSMSVLKGESATSLYGDEGKNGVIIITTQKAAKAEVAKKPDDPIFSEVEEQPQFPGGEKALKEYIANSIKYPVIALEHGIKGTVYVTFIIDQNGTVKHPSIARGVDVSLDKEALRVVSTLPLWKPAKQNNKKVNISYTVPVNFEPTPEQLHKYNRVELEDKLLKKYSNNTNNTDGPLLFVDGKETKNIEELKPEDIEKMTVLKNEQAKILYGDRAKNGVILLETKSQKKFDATDKIVIVDGKKYNGDINNIPADDISSINIQKKGNNTNIYDGKAAKDKILIQTKTKYNTKDPLIVVDGSPITKDINSIDPSTIKSVNVIKDPDNLAIYGNDARHGAILITTKKALTKTLKSEIQLRKFIAERIKYPLKPREHNQEGIVQLFMKVDEKGNLFPIPQENAKSDIFVDEVIVVAYKNDSDNVVVQDKIEDYSKYFRTEVKHVIYQILKLDIEDYKDKTIAITVKFQLQDK